MLRTRLSIPVSQAALPRILYLAPFPLFYRRIARNGTAQSKSHQSYFERCKKRTPYPFEVDILAFPKSASLLVYHLAKLPRFPNHAHPTNVSPRHNPHAHPHRRFPDPLRKLHSRDRPRLHPLSPLQNIADSHLDGGRWAVRSPSVPLLTTCNGLLITFIASHFPLAPQSRYELPRYRPLVPTGKPRHEW